MTYEAVSSTLAPPAKRCAIYTRSSPLDGADLSPITLDKQRRTCAAYIQAQRGWTVLADRYDDLGKSGANMHRPALQRLLADIAAGRVDVVVVHAVDRLSRWYLDFATMMDDFRAAGVAFVSVAEDFSTADERGLRILGMVMTFSALARVAEGPRTLRPGSLARGSR